MPSARENRLLSGVLLSAVALLAGPSACSSDDTASRSQAICRSDESGEALSYENFGQPFFLSWCTGCHARDLTQDERQGAPLGVDFDTLAGIQSQRARIVARAVHQGDMPPAGGPTAAQRELLETWLGCGGPGDEPHFEAKPSVPVFNAPSGTCAGPREPLPDAVLPRCSAVTYQCVQSCAGRADVEACRGACLAADPTPPALIGGFPVTCASCTLLQLFACGERQGCHDPLASALCCSERECPPGSAENCTEQRCPSESRSLGVCLGYAAEECLSYTSGELARCFAR